MDHGTAIGELPEIPDQVWHTALPFTPTLRAFTPGLALAIGEGRRGTVRTPVATIRFNLPAVYHGRIAPAIFVVAIDVVTGEVFAEPCAAADSPPAVYDPAPVSTTLLTGGVVNIDLIPHLMLPPRAARYRVFAWLDEWATSTTVVEISADPSRRVSGLRAPTDGTAEIRPISASGPIGLHAKPGGVVQATWPLDAATPVVVIGYGLEPRLIRWRAISETRGAELDPAAFLGRSGVAAFAVVVGDQVTTLRTSAN